MIGWISFYWSNFDFTLHVRTAKFGLSENQGCVSECQLDFNPTELPKNLLQCPNTLKEILTFTIKHRLRVSTIFVCFFFCFFVAQN